MVWNNSMGGKIYEKMCIFPILTIKRLRFCSFFNDDWNNFQNLINVWYGINACWVDFYSKPDKHTPTFIR